MVIPPLISFNRNPYNGYINPYYWVDDHPLLYGNVMGVGRPWHICYCFHLFLPWFPSFISLRFSLAQKIPFPTSVFSSWNFTPLVACESMLRHGYTKRWHLMKMIRWLFGLQGFTYTARFLDFWSCGPKNADRNMELVLVPFHILNCPDMFLALVLLWTWNTYVILEVFPPPFTSQKRCFRQTRAHLLYLDQLICQTNPEEKIPKPMKKKKHNKYMTLKNSYNSLLFSSLPMLIPLQTTPIDSTSNFLKPLWTNCPTWPRSAMANFAKMNYPEVQVPSLLYIIWYLFIVIYNYIIDNLFLRLSMISYVSL